MNKKMMVLAVVSAAMVALPAAATAHPWHLDKTSTFSVSGSSVTLTSTENFINITCNTVTGTGVFTSTTGGTMSLTFHGCAIPPPFGPCTSPGKASGTIITTPAALAFDAIMIENNKPGILITPTSATEVTPGNRLISEFNCGLTWKIFGNGIIGSITSPACGVASKTGTLGFTSSQAGHQSYQMWTGKFYGLSTTRSGKPEHIPASIDANATITFPEARTITCTNT